MHQLFVNTSRLTITVTPPYINIADTITLCSSSYLTHRNLHANRILGAIAEYPSTFEAVYFKVDGYWILCEKIRSNHMLYLNATSILTIPLIYNTLHRCTQPLNYVTVRGGPLDILGGGVSDPKKKFMRGIELEKKISA